MRKPPKIELHLKSRKLLFEGREAIEVGKWPVRFLITSIGIGLITTSICLLAAVGYVRGL